ncbi:MAG: DoxX family membrane protein [Thermoanaerobaculia bacterium]|nr:DoxX family membrane protein [Thermoanaerobaculia bacterium]
MDKLCLIARILLGLIFFVFGLNGFFNFLPPPELPQAAQEFFGALAATGYFLTFVKLTEVVCGLLLLIGRFVPLALTILAPVVLNIVLFHIFLAPAPEGSALGFISLLLGIFVAWCYRDSFGGVLAANAKPA